MVCFSKILKQEIMDNWQDKPFTYRDFLPLAKKHGKKSSSITNQLFDMANAGQLNIVGSQRRPNGGSPSRVYMMVEGAELIATKTPFSHAEWLKQQREKELFMLQCADRLDSALNKMTLLRIGSFANKDTLASLPTP